MTSGLDQREETRKQQPRKQIEPNTTQVRLDRKRNTRGISGAVLRTTGTFARTLNTPQLLQKQYILTVFTEIRNNVEISREIQPINGRRRLREERDRTQKGGENRESLD